MRCRATLLLAITWLWWLPWAGRLCAQDTRPTEYQIKAAFLYNFAKFIEWPPQAMGSDTAPMIIGVLGENPFHNDLEQVIRNKTVDHHPLVVKYFSAAEEALSCHILFISSSEKARLPQILKTLNGASVLTIGEMDRFTQNGGMINFVLQVDRIHFQINNIAATKAGLKISSKLLALAVPAE